MWCFHEKDSLSFCRDIADDLSAPIPTQYQRLLNHETSQGVRDEVYWNLRQMLILLPKSSNSCNKIFAVALKTGVLGIFSILCHVGLADEYEYEYQSTFVFIFKDFGKIFIHIHIHI